MQRAAQGRSGVPAFFELVQCSHLGRINHHVTHLLSLRHWFACTGCEIYCYHIAGLAADEWP